MLCNATHCKSICWSPSHADNRNVLEHHLAAKQYLVHSIWGMHNGELERYMLKQWPTVDNTRSNWYPVQAEVDTVKSHFIQSTSDNIVELHDLHCFESNAECLTVIDSLPADNKYLLPVVECVWGGVCGPCPMLRESKAANEWADATLLPGRSNPGLEPHQI